MSETTITATDWSARRFPVLDVNCTLDDGSWLVFGHDDAECRQIARILDRDCSLDEHLVSVEFYDGEIRVDTPWPCPRCVSVGAEPRPLSEIAALHGETERVGGPSESSERQPVEHDPREAEAIEFAKAYAGSFDFMVSMREKCSKVVVRLSPKMIDAILRCKAREADAPAAGNVRPNKFAASCGTCRNEVAEGAGRIEKVDGRWVAFHLDGGCPSEAPEQHGEARKSTPASTPAPEVPAGRYAVETDEGHLAFYRVDRPDEVRWAGRTFVSVQASDDFHPVKGEAGKSVLRKIAVDPKSAMLRYGQEIGRCGHCGRTLTDEDSRRRGIGPVCAKGFGW